MPCLETDGCRVSCQNVNSSPCSMERLQGFRTVCLCIVVFQTSPIKLGSLVKQVYTEMQHLPLVHILNHKSHVFSYVFRNLRYKNLSKSIFFLTVKVFVQLKKKKHNTNNNKKQKQESIEVKAVGFGILITFPWLFQELIFLHQF